MKPVLVIGASSFGKLLRNLLEDTGREFAGYVDDFNEGDGIIGRRSDLGARFTANDFDLVLAVGYRHLAARLQIFEEASALGFHFPALAHPRAYVSDKATVGAGSMVMAGANVDAFAQVDSLCVLWPGSIVSHDSVVGRNCFLSPGATLCGFVTLGDSTFMGAGSVVVDGADVPPGAFIKAASRLDRKALVAP